MQMFNSVLPQTRASQHCPCLGSLVGAEGFGDESPLGCAPNLARREYSCVKFRCSVPHTRPQPGNGSPEESGARDGTEVQGSAPCFKAPRVLCIPHPFPWLKVSFTRPLLQALLCPPVPLLKEGNQNPGRVATRLESWDGAS